MWAPHLRPMRIYSDLIFAIVLPMVSTLILPTNAYANIPASFVFTGSGYGHGVGMSQIGARGMALESATATEILTHFYPGTAVLPISDSQIIRINIGHRQRDALITLRPVDPKQSTPPQLSLFNGRLAFGQRAHEAVGGLAAFDQHTRGDGPDAKGLGQLLLVVGVDFDQFEAAAVIGFELFQHGAQRFARVFLKKACTPGTWRQAPC